MASTEQRRRFSVARRKFCQVVQADRAKQAAAYAAVNGNITKTTAQQLYHAKLAAKDAHALALADVCAAADVEILRKNLIRSDIKKGQTTPSPRRMFVRRAAPGHSIE